VIRLALHEAGIPFAVVQPSTLKRLATGKGNAGKDEVLAAAIRRLGFDGHDNNEADALWLLAAGHVWYGAPGAPQLPASHREALAKVQWPDLIAAAA
jgi:Holliday junction resolvasome RuvABC endonuclease subunit